MSNSRTRANRQALDAATKAKMAGRKEGDVYTRSRFMPTQFIFSRDEVVLHVFGDATSRVLLLEYYDQKIDYRYIDSKLFIADNITQNTDFFLNVTPLPISTAKEFFHASEDYYFGYCIPRANLSPINNNFHLFSSFTFKSFETAINSAFATQLESTHDNQLSLFDKNTTIAINKKNLYAEWLKKWDRESTYFLSIEDTDAARTLRLLKSYLGGGTAKRLFTHPKRHYCDEITELLTLYLDLRPLESADDEYRKSLSRDSVTALLEVNVLNTSSFSLQNPSKVTVSIILRTLKNKIALNDQNELKLHGDLYALLQVIKDKTGVDYFNLDKAPNAEPENRLVR